MSTKGKILVVDDQEGIRKLMAETCSLLGYDVETLSSGEKALEVMKDTYFDVLLIDMKMPGLSGIETFEMVKKFNPDIKSILMTGYGESYLADDVLAKGFCHVIQKPFDISEVMSMLDKTINGA